MTEETSEKRVKVEMTEEENEFDTDNRDENVQSPEDISMDEGSPRRSNRTIINKEKRFSFLSNKKEGIKILSCSSSTGNNKREIRNVIRKRSQ